MMDIKVFKGKCIGKEVDEEDIIFVRKSSRTVSEISRIYLTFFSMITLATTEISLTINCC